MEYLTSSVNFDIFMDNYFTSFCLLTHLRVNNIRAIGVFNESRLRYHWGQTAAKKRNVAFLNNADQATRQCNLTVVGYNDWLVGYDSAIYIASSEPKRFVRC